MRISVPSAIKGYIACNYELEKAMTYLVETLEKAGVADKTMIVLTTDHFPYGLTDEEFSELSGRPITNVFEKMRASASEVLKDKKTRLLHIA